MIVSGKLKKQATIKLTSLGSSGCLEGMYSKIVTEEDGSFTLEVIDGSYDIEIMYDNSYIYEGVLKVDNGIVDSPF